MYVWYAHNTVLLSVLVRIQDRRSTEDARRRTWSWIGQPSAGLRDPPSETPVFLRLGSSLWYQHDCTEPSSPRAGPGPGLCRRWTVRPSHGPLHSEILGCRIRIPRHVYRNLQFPAAVMICEATKTLCYDVAAESIIAQFALKSIFAVLPRCRSDVGSDG